MAEQFETSNRQAISDNGGNSLSTTSQDLARQGAGVKVFLSYARIDDEHLAFVGEFSKQMEYFVNSSTDDFHLDVFYDIHSLDWGDDWPQEIEESLRAASIFIPFLSANYLRRPNCRKEFNQFYQGADSLGVTDLIMPVMLFGGKRLFSTESNDPIAATCARMNHISLEKGIRAGVGSNEWRAAIWDASEKFISSYEKAESRLAESGWDRKLADPSSEDDDDEDQPGVLEIHDSIREIATEMTSALSEMDPSIRKLGEVANDFAANKPDDPRQAHVWIIRAAESFKEPSAKIGAIGSDVLDLAGRLDKDIRRLARIHAEVPALGGGGNHIAAMSASLSSLETVKSQLNGLLDSFLIAESMSAAVRKALRPAREGLTKITDGIAIMDTWKDLG